MNEFRLFNTALLLLFIGLKLGKVIAWSWWWVLAPLWIPALIAAVCYGGLLWLRRYETPQERDARKIAEGFREISRRLSR